MRFTVKFTRLEMDDLPALLKSGIFQEVGLSEIRYFAAGVGPNPAMDSTVDVSAGSNLMDLEALNRRLHELPAGIFRSMSSIHINQVQE